MADQARITDVDALESFRSALIVFISKTRQAINAASDSVKKTRNWLQLEQPAYWSEQMKRQQKKLEQANAELMSARLSEFIDSPVVQQMAVRKARTALQESEEKLRRTKAWAREYDRAVDPMMRTLDSLRDYIDNDLAQAVAHLVEMQKILEGYHESTAPPLAAE
ncbi:MAG: hypothetical protein R3F13_17165 [Prosthecobacter sp.]